MPNQNDFFKNKKILITGGTGSIGSEVLKFLISLNPKEIVIFSRDEYKQHQLRYKYSKQENIRYVLGDIRDLEKLSSESKGVDILFHCAALKHVPVSEEMPEEFIKTNIIGSINVAKAAICNNVPCVVSVSTDKAVNPSNVMGLTKAVQEKIFISQGVNNRDSKQRFINVRFGNVIGTHGSLFPIFYHQIKNNIPLTVTDHNMTRFYMSPEEAVNLIFWAAINGKDGEIVIKKMKAVKIIDIMRHFLDLLGKNKNYPIKKIGTRVGEKMHEHLITEEELLRVKAKDGYFVISPYNVMDLKKNVLSVNPAAKLRISNFSSSDKQNSMSVKELENYLRNFIDNVKNSSEFI